MESSGSAVLDFGRFCTGFLVVMGIGESFDLFFIPFVRASKEGEEKEEKEGAETG